MASTATVMSADPPRVSTAEFSGEGKGKKVAGWKHFVAGGVGGMTGAIVTSPFDVVKTRLQSDLFKDPPPSRISSSRHPTPSSVASSSRVLSSSVTGVNGGGVTSAAALPSAHPAVALRPTGARGLLWNFVETGQIIRNIYVDEGPRALFKGLGPTLVGVVPARSINFSTYAHSKSVLARWFPHASVPDDVAATALSEGRVGNLAEASPYVHLGAAAIAGVVTATATNPIWVVKTRLQLEARHRERSSPSLGPSTKLSPLITTTTTTTSSASSSAAAARAGPAPVVDKMLPALRMTRDILKKEGVRGMYKGMSASYLGVTEGVIQWVLYERLKKISTQTYPGQPAKSKVAEWTGIIGASGGAKMVASLITYPHEVLRTRLRQPALLPGGPLKYTGLLQTLRLVIAEEGAASLYGGLSAHLLRVVPNAACMFTIYEIALRL